MNNQQDHYRILGVTEDAEEIVIRAAYRALAQKYHPDRWTGSPAVGEEKMRSINIAYEVLSDSEKRRNYDAIREGGSFKEETNSDEESIFDSERDSDWEVAARYQPELLILEKNLSRIATELAFTFRLTLLESRNFAESRAIATALEKKFLEKFFGSDPDGQEFARELLLEGRRDAAREVNRVAKVFGFCNSNLILEIARKYNTRKLHRIRIEEQKNSAINILKLLASGQEGSDQVNRGLVVLINNYRQDFNAPIKATLIVRTNWLGAKRHAAEFFTNFESNEERINWRQARQYFAQEIERLSE